MLRGFRGTVFYNRCRQPPHVRTILSLAFTRYPSYTYVYTAYEQRLFPFLVVGRGRTWDPRALPHRSHIVDCRVFLISPKSEKETLGLEIFPPPSPPPSLHPTGNGFLFVFLERQERLFFLSLPPLPRKRAKNWTRRTKGRRARGEGIHRGEVWRAPVPGRGGGGRLFEGNLRRIVFRIHKRPIEIDIPGKVGPATKPAEQWIGRCVRSRYEHENNGWNCSRFNTELFSLPRPLTPPGRRPTRLSRVSRAIGEKRERNFERRGGWRGARRPKQGWAR